MIDWFHLQQSSIGCSFCSLGAFGYWLQSSPKAEIAARRRLRDWRKTTGTVTGSHLEETQGARLSQPDRLLKIKADFINRSSATLIRSATRPIPLSKYKNSFVARGEEWVSAGPPKLPLDIVAAHPARPDRHRHL